MMYGSADHNGRFGNLSDRRGGSANVGEQKRQNGDALMTRIKMSQRPPGTIPGTALGLVMAATLAIAAVAAVPRQSQAAGSDACAGAVAVSTVPYTDTTDNTAFTTAGTDPLACTGNQEFNTYWYVFTPAEDGLYSVDTFGSGYDTVLAVYKGGTSSCATLLSTDRVACGDNFVGGESLTAFSGLEGQQYLIEVMSKVGGGGAATKLNIGYAPESLLFPIKPLKMKIKAGESAATKSIKVKVKNPGNEAHVIEMNAFEIVVLGPSCNLAFGTPDFDKDMPGSQDTVMVDAGKKASATVQVSVNAADVNSIGGKPVRCMAYVILGGATPFPEVNYQNDNYVFPVDILDMNDD